MRTAAALALLPLAVMADVRPPLGDASVCRCESARRGGGWCARCAVGHVAGERIPSFPLYEYLDAHGHTIDLESLRCASCRKAVEEEGYCERCRMGFVRKQAYLTPIAYHSARGKLEDPARIACAACRENARKSGWCEACGVGRTGWLVVSRRSDLEASHAALERLRAAIHRLEDCEPCAIASLADGKCRTCKLAWKGGKAQPAP